MKLKIGLGLLLLALAIFIYQKVTTGKVEVTYQTATAERGTLIISVSASGNVVSPLDSLVKQGQAWSSYLSAKNNLASAKSRLNTLQAAEFAANQKFINDAVARGLATDDPTYIQENATWLAAEADYINQTESIKQAEIALSSAWYSYQQTIASMSTPVLRGKNKLWAVVSLAEIEAPKVEVNQKVTLILDAFAGKTYSGKVLAVNTNGITSSNVTTYPVTIEFDTFEPKIYTNMALTAKIIINIKDNVVLVPTAAITTTNGVSSIKILKDKQVETVEVTIGESNDTQTEIVTDLIEGEEVVIGTNNITSPSRSGTTTSPFGGSGFGGGSTRVFRGG